MKLATSPSSKCSAEADEKIVQMNKPWVCQCSPLVSCRVQACKFRNRLDTIGKTADLSRGLVFSGGELYNKWTEATISISHRSEICT
jgi:hypothetical protein